MRLRRRLDLLLLVLMLLLLLLKLHGTHAPNGFLPLDSFLLSGLQHLFILNA
jgi:hypothetical protein